MPPKKKTTILPDSNETQPEPIDQHTDDEDSLFDEESPAPNPEETIQTQTCPICNAELEGM